MNTHSDIGNIFTAGKIAELAKSADQAQSPPLSDSEQSTLVEKIKGLLIEENAVLVAHYYVDGIIQDLAEASGGFVGDSLEMAKFGLNHDAETVVVAGVRFMGDTAKILSPEKRILMVEMEAECSLDLACGIEEFDAFCDKHPDRTVVVYANTSAAVKARADWVVTSSIAKDVVSHLSNKGDKILWAPDRFLGSYVKKSTGADMILWDGSCIVHEEFKVDALQKLVKSKPDAKVLVHPESPGDVIDLADVVGSTTQIINAARDLDADTFIVATDQGIFHKMSQLVPGKTFIAAPTAGEGATCVSCAECPWMKLNDLQRLAALLAPNSSTVASSEIIIEEKVRKAAERSIFRMVEFNQTASAD